MNKKLVIYGASGHGKVAADIARLNGYEEIIFYDDDLGKSVLGPYQVIHDFKGYEDYDLFIAIGDNATREKISLRMKKEIITLVHPAAVIAEDVTIGKGVVVMAKAVVNSGTVLRDGVIVNTCASIDHDNRINEYVHISVNAHTAGTVTIGKRTFIGMSVSIINNITICEDALIGAGALVVDDIREAGTYIGIPAKKK
ncbi:MAG: acetyltransferase [Erysipelotrichaceae bacterium]|nr:acetyltransferase [Erysipelotrichaceae bacterium]